MTLIRIPYYSYLHSLLLFAFLIHGGGRRGRRAAPSPAPSQAHTSTPTPSLKLLPVAFARAYTLTLTLLYIIILQLGYNSYLLKFFYLNFFKIN